MSTIDLQQLWQLTALMKAQCITNLELAGLKLVMSPLAFSDAAVNTGIIPPEPEPSEQDLLFHSSGGGAPDMPPVPEGLINGV